MSRAARYVHPPRDPAPAATPAHPDTADLREITERAVRLYSERDPRAACVALARGASRQTRGAKLAIVGQLVETLAEREPGLFDDCLTYLARLRSQMPAS